MKKYLLLTLLILSSFLTTSCLTISLFNKPDNINFHRLCNPIILKDDISSWYHHSRTELIKAWGIPSVEYQINAHELQIDYYRSTSVQQTIENSSSVSSYSETLDKTFTNTTKTGTTINQVTDAYVTFYCTDEIITHIKFYGDYDLLDDICKYRTSDERSLKSQTAIALKEYLRNHEWTELSTEDYFNFVLTLDKDFPYNSDSISSSLEFKINDENKNPLNKLHSKRHEDYLLAGNYIDINHIPFSLARILYYRQTEEGENFDYTPYLSECKYSVDDIINGSVAWNEIPLAEVKKLQRYAPDYFLAKQFHLEDTFFKEFGYSKESIAKYMENMKWDRSNFVDWILIVEYYNEFISE